MMEESDSEESATPSIRAANELADIYIPPTQFDLPQSIGVPEATMRRLEKDRHTVAAIDVRYLVDRQFLLQLLDDEFLQETFLAMVNKPESIQGKNASKATQSCIEMIERSFSNRVDRFASMVEFFMATYDCYTIRARELVQQQVLGEGRTLLHLMERLKSFSDFEATYDFACRMKTELDEFLSQCAEKAASMYGDNDATSAKTGESNAGRGRIPKSSGVKWIYY